MESVDNGGAMVVVTVKRDGKLYQERLVLSPDLIQYGRPSTLRAVAGDALERVAVSAGLREKEEQRANV